MDNLSNLAKKVLEYLEPDQNKWDYWTKKHELYPVTNASCMKQFVEIIDHAIRNKEKILVAGDYDCDGILATSIMVDGLNSLGLQTGFYIPDRIKEGYGLNINTVELAHKKGYSILITVDNGVKAFDALQKALSYGMKVIVTDHHQIDEMVPCTLLVHPTLMEEEFSTLCGAGVSYECIRALGADTDYHLMLAGVASVGDVMEVTGQTRALIQNGIRLLNQNKENHLYSLADDCELNETSIGFQVVPKLNAIGRLSNLANVNNCVRYFLNQDAREIYHFHSQLTRINDLRKRISSQMKDTALKKCVPQDPILLIRDISFHEGIIGLVAGSLCSQFQKPVIVIAQNPQGYKASMRSPRGFDCMDFLNRFDDFCALGGHAQAAGFSLDLHAYERFEQFVKNEGSHFSWTLEPVKTLKVTSKELTLDAIESLDSLRPFGPGFAFPSFELEEMHIKSFYDLSNGKHRRYTLEDGLQCLYFNIPQQDSKKSVNSIRSFIGSCQINRYRGKKQVNFIIDQIVYK